MHSDILGCLVLVGDEHVVTRYPWHTLEMVDRAACRASARGRQVLSARLRINRLTQSLASLVQAPVECSVREERPTPRFSLPDAIALGFGFADKSLYVILHAEPALGFEILRRVLSQPPAIAKHAMTITAAMHGALAAVAVEVARRSGATVPITVMESLPTSSENEQVAIELTLLLDNKSFAVSAHLLLPNSPGATEPPPPRPAELGALPVPLPVVVGQTLCTRSDLHSLRPGDVLVPGAGWFSQQPGRGRAILAPGYAEHGLSVELGEQGEIVVGGEPAPLAMDNERNTKTGSFEATAADVVLKAPLVVRIELGSVTLTAEQWARLKPGDVIESGQRLNQPVILRTGGQEIAQGEIVNVQGELGVRIRHLLVAHPNDPSSNE